MIEGIWGQLNLMFYWPRLLTIFKHEHMQVCQPVQSATVTYSRFTGFDVLLIGFDVLLIDRVEHNLSYSVISLYQKMHKSLCFETCCLLRVLEKFYDNQRWADFFQFRRTNIYFAIP